MAYALTKRTYAGILLGFEVRKSISKTYTYRIRRGNGYYGSVAGLKYQDRYFYFVPTSINNPESEPVRLVFAAGVAHWKNNLTLAEKTAYNNRALKIGSLSGYNLFLKEYIRGNL